MKALLEEGQLLLCTVKKIVGTTVFVKIEDYNLEGTLSFPEIAPGRIRNIREYAFPGKKIVCKVLRVKPGVIELSLRRVRTNERNEFNEKYKKERNYTALLKTIISEKADEIISKIKEQEGSLFDLFKNSEEKPELLDRYFSKEQAGRITQALSEKKVKETTVSKRFSLSSKSPNGIVIVKSIIKEASHDINPEISYIAAGKYIAKLKTKNPKQAESQFDKMILAIESLAKKYNCSFRAERE